ncbi:MAG: hypothetical protein HY273_13610 [Gammaproteobacteria bacterium]|nr:hypothetical protein [Gammaproteobacteria bacterium]
MKSAATYTSRPSSAALICLSAALACAPVTAAEPENIDPHDPDFEPGYRFVQAYSEDGIDLSSKGIELGWAAINRHGYELDLSTGLRLVKRYFDDQLFGGWTASVAISAPWPVALLQITLCRERALSGSEQRRGGRCIGVTFSATPFRMVANSAVAV